jgi:putative oxidoreductase
MNMHDLLKLLLRLTFGGLMLLHGYPKLIKLFSNPLSEVKFADPLGLGPALSLILTVLAEFLFAIFVLVGFRTKLATYPLIFTMAIAALVVHAGDPLGDREMALLYLTGFITIAIVGGGKYSIDGLLGKKNN